MNQEQKEHQMVMNGEKEAFGIFKPFEQKQSICYFLQLIENTRCHMWDSNALEKTKQSETEQSMDRNGIVYHSLVNDLIVE